MRLRERFGHGGRDEGLDAEAERELAAVEAGVDGLPVEGELEDVALLAGMVRDERELPSARFSEKLDEWAAAGFPRAGGPRRQRAQTGFAALRERLAATPPRRIIAPAGAALTLLVVIGVAIGESGSIGGSGAGTPTSQPPGGVLEKAAEDGTAPQAETAGGSGAQDSTAPQAGAGESQAQPGADLFLAPAGSASDVPPANRKIARSVDLALATSPAEFRDSADGVLDVIQAHHGFVRSSNVSGGDPQVKGSQIGQASFDLRIPAGELEATLGELSDLGHVVSRTDGTQDITSRFVSAKKRIAALEKARQSLLTQLQGAVTVAEQQSIKRRLGIVERQLNAAENDLDSARRRVQLVPVGVTIRADQSIGATGGGGSWSVGDALHDAGRVLEVAAGVLVISAAVLVPVTLVALIALLGAREVNRRRREAALD